MRKLRLISSAVAFVLLLAGFGIAGAAEKENGKRKALDPDGIARLEARTGGKARVSVSPATGAARFVKLEAGFRGDLMAESTAGPRQKARAFMQEYGRMLGLRDADAEVTLVGERADKLGARHLTYEQFYRGVPVFAGLLRAHFDGDGRLLTVNGNLIPGIRVNPNPTRSAAEAAAMAIALISGENDGREVYARSGILTVYRTGLARGVDGESHLTWQVEVGNDSDIREFIYVDAHTGKLVDRLPGIMDALDRRAYDGMGANPGPNYPANPFWVEGQVPFPDPVTQTEPYNMLTASEETYDTFFNTFGRDSFDGDGAIMDAIFNRGPAAICPNASWNGLFISFCPDTTSDDVTAHEWGHAYTQYTHNLIYLWQPGALNESYSDIWGEVVDVINGRQTDIPGGLRTAGSCTAFTRLPGELVINSPAGIAGTYLAQNAGFGPSLTIAGTTADVVLVDDGFPPTADGCERPFVNAAAIAGKIALIDRGVCQFSQKVYGAQLAGAIGVIIANNVAVGLPGMGAGLDAGLVTIPSLGVTQATGDLIKAAIVGGGVNSTLRTNFTGPVDSSYRWLMGEDAGAFFGAIRDMWNPNCYGDPARVSDPLYFCGTGDGGGVHSNSGVPNHAFALIADGGTYNGQTVTGLGLTKAAHIYYRAQTVYQHPASDFADHEDAIEQSAADLEGVPLKSLTGGPDETITAADVIEVGEAMDAVEMSDFPTQCDFEPILSPDAPDRCASDLTEVPLFFDDFESGSDGWSVSHTAVTKKDFTDRDWELTDSLPGGRESTAFFGIDPDIGTCAPGGDESGVLHLTSPLIILPGNAANPLLTFDHYVATEAGFDGGNLKIRVNGGPYTLVAPADFTFNPYNTTLISAAGGNTNPLAGQSAFSGTNPPTVLGSWGRSHVDLSAYAGPNDKISLRWDFGSDGCAGLDGWYVDDVTVYACLPTLSIEGDSVDEGDSGKTPVTFTVTLSPASASDVTVQYKSADGTATAGGNDYVPTGVKTLTIPAGDTEGFITVDVKGDTADEADEFFFVNLSKPTNATIVDGQGQGTIEDDD